MGMEAQTDLSKYLFMVRTQKSIMKSNAGDV